MRSPFLATPTSPPVVGQAHKGRHVTNCTELTPWAPQVEHMIVSRSCMHRGEAQLWWWVPRWVITLANAGIRPADRRYGTVSMRVAESWGICWFAPWGFQGLRYLPEPQAGLVCTNEHTKTLKISETACKCEARDVHLASTVSPYLKQGPGRRSGHRVKRSVP